MVKRIFYLTDTKEGFDELESAMNKFSASYARIPIGKQLQVKKGIDNCIEITPTCEITEIQQLQGDQTSKGNLERVTIQHSFVNLNLEGIKYQINFYPEGIRE